MVLHNKLLPSAVNASKNHDHEIFADDSNNIFSVDGTKKHENLVAGVLRLL